MKLGIVGAGTIVPDFLNAAKEIQDIEVVSISGQESDLKIMKKLAEENTINNIYTNYSDMLKDDIEIVYVAVPNSLHYKFAMEALEAGKNVILEKPFVSSYKEAKELIGFANEKKLFIFEAISNQYLPNYLNIKDTLKDLGDIKIVQLNYSQYSRRYDLFKEGKVLPVFDPKKSGGALMDLNVYNIHFILGLFGKPDKIQYIANVERNIDTSGILTLEYPTFKCVSIGAKDCKAPVTINIQGDKGFIHSDEPANVFNNFIKGRNLGDIKHYNLNSNKNRLFYEIKEFARVIKEKDYEVVAEYNNHTLNVIEILDEARKQVGIEII